MKENASIPLVYILSNGRSGTTLLDLLLGAHSRIWTVGEAQLLPWELVNSKRPCGCGQPFDTDPFWQEVLSSYSADAKGYHIGYFRNRNHVGRVLRWSHLPDLLRGSVRSSWEAAADEYARSNHEFFQTVRSVAEDRVDDSVRWLVDASKDPYRLFWLQQCPQFDIRVIHLMKSPRAFVASAARPWLSEPAGIRKVVRFAARWVIENTIMARLCTTCFSPHQVRQLRYEELAEQPEATMQALVDWLNLDYSRQLTRAFRDYENHAISGNAMRWRNSDDEIRLDERWKRDLSMAQSKLVRQLTYPFLQYCRYEEAPDTRFPEFSRVPVR